MRLGIVMAILAIAATACPAQQRSAKRGLSWDETTLTLQAAHIEQLAMGVSWVYNWGNAPHLPELYSATTIAYAPMCWNSNYDEAAIRSYLQGHPETKYLLGFNEPNFSSQANMTPAQAAAAWPQVEQIAADYGLTLVAPALNFSGEYVGGRIWNPYEWLDEFLRLYPAAHIDCLALHSYMNWYSANTWFATEYFYSDLYDPEKSDVYGRYPNLVAFLDSYKAANGHFPRMMLTEFCAWENDGSITGVDFQIDQMTQKVQKLEQSDLVEGYAWFIGNATASAYPYMSILETVSADSELSALGKVYVNMSSFDTDKWYAEGETIAAKDYVEATTDDRVVRLRPNTDLSSAIPLQIELPTGAWAQYQIDVAAAGSYTFTLHVNCNADTDLTLYADSRRTTTTTLPTTDGSWADRTFTATLTAGKHDVMFYNASTASLLLSSWRFSRDAGITAAAVDDPSGTALYDLQGQRVDDDSDLPAGIYIRITPHKTDKTLLRR